MKLVLDSRGGVHFPMEVDMDTALGKLQEQNIDTEQRAARRGAFLRDQAWKQLYHAGLEHRLPRQSSGATRRILISALAHRDPAMPLLKDNSLKAVMTDERPKEAQRRLRSAEYYIPKTREPAKSPSRWFASGA
ncbi:hypothetical protein MJ579_06540 [Klebsiella pneumoniae]|nr:hypothetical protein MJ579_06540 [Klebsiella pneumoniae]